MNLNKKLRKFVDFFTLFNFRWNRSKFYRSLADSFEQNEQFKSFLLEEMKISKDKKTANAGRAKAMKIMYRAVDQGDDEALSKMLCTVMPKSDELLLRALDDSKDKPQTLRVVANAVEKQREAALILLKALGQPAMLLPGVVVFVYILVSKVLPVMIKAANRTPNPSLVWTQQNAFVRDYSMFLYHNWYYIAICIVVLVVFGCWLLPNWRGKIRTRIEGLSSGVLFLMIPVFPYGLACTAYKEYKVAQTMSALSVLTQAGKTLVESLDTLRGVANPYMKYQIRKILHQLDENSVDYVSAFSKGFLNQELLAEMATTIRNKPDFDAILQYLGNEGLDVVLRGLHRTTTGLKIALMVLTLGTVVILYTGQLSISLGIQAATQSRPLRH